MKYLNNKIKEISNLSAKIKNLPNKSKYDRTVFLADVLENSLQPFISGYPDGSIMYCNSAFCNLTGYTKRELENMTWAIDLTPPEWQDFEKHILNELNETGKPQRYQKEYLRKDGSKVPIELYVLGVTKSNGKILYYNAFLTDISERKKLENEINHYQENLEKLVKERTVELENTIEQLREVNQKMVLSDERFALFFNVCPLPIVIVDFTSNKIINGNQSFLEKHGYQIGEVIGKNALGISLWVNSKDRNKVIKIVHECGSVQNFEAKFRNQTGKIYEALFSAVKINIDEKPCLLSITVDITEKKKFEKEMLRLDKLNLIGQMSAGIGHEIRNPMTSVRGFLQLLANKETDSKNMEYYDIMIEELDRANSIITEFLSLARDRVVELKPISLNEIINAMYPLLSSDAIVQDRVIILNIGDVPNILLDEKEIRQLIINLVRNAIEASLSMGVITISTYNRDDEVVLSVEDAGTGIPPEIYDKLGTPFVTSKVSGTGIGVSVCYSIAHKHNAKIDVKTGSTGTTFYVRFKIPKKNRTKELV